MKKKEFRTTIEVFETQVLGAFVDPMGWEHQLHYLETNSFINVQQISNLIKTKSPQPEDPLDEDMELHQWELFLLEVNNRDNNSGY